MHYAHGHISAASTRHRLRQDALGALRAVTQTAQIRQTAEGFERAATGLAAALAGPGLLFAAWGLDIFSGPWWATHIAAGCAWGLLLLVLAFQLRLWSPSRVRAKGRAVGVGVASSFVFVAVLFGAGLQAPALSRPSDAT
jgi:hypothetical protein